VKKYDTEKLSPDFGQNVGGKQLRRG